MKYIITGSLGNISKPLGQELISAGHAVTIISSNPEKKQAIEALGAKAAIGSIEDVSFLTRTFEEADAVYTMVPPTFTAQDWKKHITRIGENYAEAIRKAGVKNVLNLSSIGAHMPEGCGPVSGLFGAEKALNSVPDINVLHLRPGFFYSNFISQVGMVKHLGIIGGNYGVANKLVLVHTRDIAAVAARELLSLSFKGKSYRYVVSDEKTTDEIASELGTAIGKPDLKWVDFPDDQNKAGLLQAGLPEELAKNYTEMGTAMRSGEMFSDYKSGKGAYAGRIKLKDFASEFATAYKQ
jgi:uncharacterized protein YbjT (DUF2867 family)